MRSTYSQCENLGRLIFGKSWNKQYSIQKHNNKYAIFLTNSKSESIRLFRNIAELHQYLFALSDIQRNTSLIADLIHFSTI